MLERSKNNVIDILGGDGSRRVRMELNLDIYIAHTVQLSVKGNFKLGYTITRTDYLNPSE